MAAIGAQPIPAQLQVHTPDGKTRKAPLEADRYRVGRGDSNQLSFPGVIGLSREHAEFARQGSHWIVRDLASTNGVFVNGARIEAPHTLRPGDRVNLGELTVTYTEQPVSQGVVFDENPSDPAASTTMSASIEGLLRDAESQGAAHMKALIRAGRELAGHMPIEKLFELILNLSVEAVGAARGVLMTLDGEDFRVRAMQGAGIRISSRVRDVVTRERRSLLVRDAMLDEDLAGRMSIVQQQVRSMLAAPLQTDDRVIGLIYLDSLRVVREFTKDDLNLLTVMANIAAVRIEQARLAAMEQAEKLREKELEHAALIQRSILPSVFPPFPHRTDFQIHAEMICAREVGGDLFDFFLLDPGHLGFVIGDVSGKGVPAALFMAVTRTLLKATAQHRASPGECLTYMNATLAEENRSGMFVTLFYGVLDTSSGELQFANAGHNPPYLISKDRQCQAVREKSGPMLGLLEGLEYRTLTRRMEPGQSLLLYTDGVTEAIDRGGNFFEEAGLEQYLSEHGSEPVEPLALGLRRTVEEFSKGRPQADDITIMALRYSGL
jgi:sigma-B regulation protein RsbU (phosphoserine phosphatase)